MSDYDLFIHQNFFAAPQQVAWVFDPHSDEEGCFGWVSGEVASIKRISVLKHASETYPEAAQVGPHLSSLDIVTTPTKRTKLRFFAFKKWTPYAFIAMTVLLAVLAIYLSKAAHKALPVHLAASKQQTSRSLEKWKQYKRLMIRNRLLSQDVKELFNGHSDLITITNGELRDLQPTMIDGERNPGPDDQNIQNVKYVITYNWIDSKEDKGSMDIRYIYDCQKHKVGTDVDVHLGQGIDRSDYKRELRWIAEVLGNLLFKEK